MAPCSGALGCLKERIKDISASAYTKTKGSSPKESWLSPCQASFKLLLNIEPGPYLFLPDPQSIPYHFMVNPLCFLTAGQKHVQLQDSRACVRQAVISLNTAWLSLNYLEKTPPQLSWLHFLGGKTKKNHSNSVKLGNQVQDSIIMTKLYLIFLRLRCWLFISVTGFALCPLSFRK